MGTSGVWWTGTAAGVFLAQVVATLTKALGDVPLMALQDDGQPVVVLAPRWLVHTDADGRHWEQVATPDRLGVAMRRGCADPLGLIRSRWAQAAAQDWAGEAGVVRFGGGLAGFFGHELMAAAARGRPTDRVDGPLSGLWVGAFDVWLRCDGDGCWRLHGPNDGTLATLRSRLVGCLDAVVGAGAKVDGAVFDRVAVGSWRPLWSRAAYAQAFARVQGYLQAGDCYQVNLTQPWVARCAGGSLLPLAAGLWAYSRAPYAGWVRMLAGVELLSCSPELLLAVHGDGEVVTRPIKGTRPRAVDAQADAALAAALAASEKDRAENLMIVDLLRNDLGRVALTGSVRVPVLFEVQRFAQVHHLVSEVRARLQRPVDALHLLLDALPGGSVTGAPKVRALEIIAELEAGPRGAYCGSMGYLNFDGRGRWNVLIRTLQLQDETLWLWAGGGITVASREGDEHQECLDKVGGLMRQVTALAEPLDSTRNSTRDSTRDSDLAAGHDAEDADLIG